MDVSVPADFVCPGCGLTAEDMRQEEWCKSQIRALLVEREGYLQRGLTDDVAEVDRQLEYFGHTLDVADAAAPALRAERRPRAAKGELR
jgi:hypothetical protein